MLDKLDAMIGFHRQALNLREQRQQILAINIANSDTPHYQARDIDFNDTLNQALKQKTRFPASNIGLNCTAATHLSPTSLGQPIYDLLYRQPYQSSADGNTVEMDSERLAMADNSVRYQASLTFLGEQFKSLMSVIQQG